MQHINRIHTTFFLHNIPLENRNGGDVTPTGSGSNLQPDDGSYPLNDDMDSEEIDSQWYGPGAKLYRNYHTKLNGTFLYFLVVLTCVLIFGRMQGRPCDENGTFLLDNTPPPPYSDKRSDDWTPYANRVEFELTKLLYSQIQMAGTHINKLMDIFSAFLRKHDDRPSFARAAEMYAIIDSIRVGEVKWDSFGIQYTGEKPEVPAPWMDEVYNVWMRDPESCIGQIIGNPDFASLMDYMPYREYVTETNMRRWQDFMSGNWAWQEAVG